MVSSPFRYWAAWETAFWRSQFLNQLVCVDRDAGAQQNDERQHGNRDIASRAVAAPAWPSCARLKRLADAEVYSPLPRLPAFRR